MPAKLRVKNIEVWMKALDPKGFDRAMRKRIGKATSLNAHLAKKTQHDVIKASDGIDGNAALTLMAKKGDKPLIGRSVLFRAISARKKRWNLAFSGVMRKHKLFDVAMIAHYGAAVPVTEKMRSMFFFLWKASEGELPTSKLSERAQELFRYGKRWLPLKDSTTAITIPGRPWAKIAFGKSELGTAAAKNWREAVEDALRERARGGS